MKLFNKIWALALAGAIGFSACDKVDPLPFFELGVKPTVSLSSSTIAAPPSDSLKEVLTVNWTYPQYATDSSRNRYIIQIDSAGRNFSKAVTREVIGALSSKFTAKALNEIMLGFGFQFNRAYDLDVRVISSYNNNNERYFSDAVKLRATPYKIPPKVVLPASGKLFIIGSATQGDWVNPVSTPTQELSRIDETTFAGVFQMIGGKQFLILPENGNWDLKYALADNSLPGLDAGGNFGFNVAGSHNANFIGPKTDGLFKIVLDFQTGKFTITPFTLQHGLPTQLVVVGGGTPQGWDNTVGNTQKFTRKNATEFTIEVDMFANGEYLILPEPGNWGKKYGVEDNNIEAAKTSGSLKPEGSNFKTPGAGKYRIEVNFANNASYKLTKL